MTWRVVLTKLAAKDAKKIKQAGLKSRAEELLRILQEDPFQNPPPFKKLTGDMAGIYSRRINRKHRLVYEVDREKRLVYVGRMWSHYGE